MEGLIALAVLLVIVLIVLVNCIKIVPQAHAMVIERLGGYLTTWSVGLHLKVPFIDRIECHLKGAGGRFPTTACNHKG